MILFSLIQYTPPRLQGRKWTLSGERRRQDNELIGAATVWVKWGKDDPTGDQIREARLRVAALIARRRPDYADPRLLSIRGLRSLSRREKLCIYRALFFAFVVAVVLTVVAVADPYDVQRSSFPSADSIWPPVSTRYEYRWILLPYVGWPEDDNLNRAVLHWTIRQELDGWEPTGIPICNHQILMRKRIERIGGKPK